MERLYWGDLHSHAGRSFDAVGGAPYDYARDVAALDFYALTEHAEQAADGAWDTCRAEANRRDEPGRFATLVAYEATFGSPWGHHNVLFRTGDGGAVSGADRGTVLDLWDRLEEGEALTVPHHTGVLFSPTLVGSIPGSLTPTVDWQHHRDAFRPLVEIYSSHGQCEFYDPDHPLSYDKVDFTFNSSSTGPHYVWDAWLSGLRLGVVGSSDNHRGQPGRGEMGLAAVRAPDLTRAALFRALRGQRTYATTGARIVLHFAVNDVDMGGEVRRSGISGAVTARIRAHGTGVIDQVEVLRGDLDERRVSVANRWTPAALDFHSEWRDPSPPRRGFYYVRLRQRDAYRGRVPMAWSTPVWIV